MLQNASILAIVAVHTAENEPPKGLKTGLLKGGYILEDPQNIRYRATGPGPAGLKDRDESLCLSV